METLEKQRPGAVTETADAQEAEPAHAQAHAHHWVIEEAAGPNSHGVCLGCHAERDFRNWLTESDFVTRGERLYAA
ncbi:MAG: hypothetical protein ACRDG3_12055 [Tepidiformaceae bacterium]